MICFTVKVLITGKLTSWLEVINMLIEDRTGDGMCCVMDRTKYIEFKSGSRILVQFGSVSRVMF